ncbi:hypothetical protein [Leptotrichia trevisanii]|uniref:hypothetical protein n=1 Tax=Leptotrichia trevisanii TaxID=109328 RepID=UPI0004161294|nr:hypothetical protein [Leptotrichia trevisanii]
MKKRVLLLILGILGAYQLGYSENADTKNTDTKVETTQDAEMKQEQINSDETEKVEAETESNQTAETESNQTAETEEKPQTTIAPAQKEASKAKKLTPAQEKRLEAKAKRNKEKNMSLDEKLDLQILKMERLLKSLEGR